MTAKSLLSMAVSFAVGLAVVACSGSQTSSTEKTSVDNELDSNDSVAGAELDPGKFVKTGDMHDTRVQHAVVNLEDGRVLVLGGKSPAKGSSHNTTIHGTAEIYDPSNDTWTRTPDLAQPRSSHSAVLMGDGRVMVTGGVGYGSSSVEIYDPTTDTWIQVADMLESRFSHVSEVFQNGTVIVAGGNGKEALLNGTELFEP